MGLLNNLVGSALGGLFEGMGTSGAQSPLLRAALQLVQQNGGIDGIVQKFRQAGYAGEADSWVSTGTNRPLAPDALQQVLGSGAVGDIASKVGLSDTATAGGLASLLPQLIDRMTPNGQIPGDHNDLVAQALSLLQKSHPG
jgi:uncharacterized protein YidB (DUF937 family)